MCVEFLTQARAQLQNHASPRAWHACIPLYVVGFAIISKAYTHSPVKVLACDVLKKRVQNGINRGHGIYVPDHQDVVNYFNRTMSFDFVLAEMV